MITLGTSVVSQTSARRWLRLQTRKSITIAVRLSSRGASPTFSQARGPRQSIDTHQGIERSSSHAVRNRSHMYDDRGHLNPDGTYLGQCPLVGQVLADYGLSQRKTADTSAPCQRDCSPRARSKSSTGPASHVHAFITRHDIRPMTSRALLKRGLNDHERGWLFFIP